MAKRSDKLHDQECPKVFGYELDRDSLAPIRQTVDLARDGDHGCDPIGGGIFRMVPSGDVVNLEERNRRLNLPTLDPSHPLFGD
jgi:hypothetical protein